MNKYLIFAVWPAITILTLVVIKFTGLAVPLTVTTSQATNTEFSVVGEGKIDVVPDLAEMSLGITVTKAATAEDAQNQISKINNQIVAALGEFKIDKKDIKTTDFYVNPHYDYSSTGGSTTSGFDASSNLTVKVRKIDMVGEIAQAATKAGATNINNTRYVVEKPEQYRERVRALAIENAKEQAKKISGELGFKLGRITNMVESSGSDHSPMPYAAKMESAIGLGGGAPADLQAGTQTLTSTVTLYFQK